MGRGPRHKRRGIRDLPRPRPPTMHFFWQLGHQKDGRYHVSVHSGKKRELISITTNVTFEDLAECLMSRARGTRGAMRGNLRFTSNESPEHVCTGVIADSGATDLYSFHVL